MNVAPDTGVAPDDAGTKDSAPAELPLAKSDAGARAVTCTASPCADALVTTLASDGFCALLHDGTVACWGQNQNGQLGRGAAAGTADSASPALVAGLANVVAIDHTCAIDSSGSTWCWGKGPYLQDPTQATTTELDPVKLPIPSASRIGVAEAAACAVVGTDVLCWGANADGQVAVPTFGASTTTPIAPQNVALPAGAPISDLVVGRASFVIRQDGTALSWGANPPLARVSSLFPDPYPKPIVLSGVSSLDSEGSSACAVAEGVPYCWGNAFDPHNGSPIKQPLDRAIPEVARTPEPVVQIATSPDTQFAQYPQRQCAVGVSGDVFCWGNNINGQVGDGTRNFAAVPTKVVGLPAPAARVKTTPRSTCALLTNGQVFCWGDNAFGQLGGGQAKEPSLVPQEVVLP